RNLRRARYNTAMVNDRRRFWTTLVVIGLFAPFLIVFFISLAMSGQNRAVSTTLAGSAATASAPVTPHPDSPIITAGAGRDLWVVAPVSDKLFELYHRASSDGGWSKSSRRWPGGPQAMALMLPAKPDPNSRGIPYIISRSGAVDRYALEN